MTVISRTEAKKAGLRRYFTGVACPHGHVCERYVSTWQCVECVKGQSAAWDKENVDGRREINRQWRKAHPEAVRAKKAASQKRNRVSANARNRRYAAKNREKINARVASWQKANPAREAAKTRRYQAAKLNRTPKWADQEKIQNVYDLCARFRSLGCDFEVDHIIPLQGRNVCGLHVHNNLEIITAEANRSKSNHLQGA